MMCTKANIVFNTSRNTDIKIEEDMYKINLN